MGYSYVNENGKRVYGAPAYNHAIKENGGFESHNRKIARYGAEHPEIFLSIPQQLTILLKNNIPKISSKKNKKKK